MKEKKIKRVEKRYGAIVRLPEFEYQFDAVNKKEAIGYIIENVKQDFDLDITEEDIKDLKIIKKY